MCNALKKTTIMLLSLCIMHCVVSLTFAEEPSTGEAGGNSPYVVIDGTDYMILVNRIHRLPDGWEDRTEMSEVAGKDGALFELEKKTADAYEELKSALAAEGIRIDITKGRVSLAEQQEILDEAIEQDGPDAAAKAVEKPGCSEYQTGLALDFALSKDASTEDDQDDIIRIEEDMPADEMEEQEILGTVYGIMPRYGFILRCPKEKEYITGYDYNPCRIRYIDDPAAAQVITDCGITLEEYMGEAEFANEVAIDYGTSDVYSQEELEDAMLTIKKEFASWMGCTLHAIRYAGDQENTEENVKWLIGKGKGKKYDQCALFYMNFHSPTSGIGSWGVDTENTDYQWWLARAKNGDWEIAATGYFDRSAQRQ